MVDKSQIHIPEVVKEKQRKLEAIIGNMQSVVVAFSGGVDSGLLSLVAHHVLGNKMLAVTLHSPVEPDGEVDEAVKCANQVGFAIRVLEINDLDNPDFARNPINRCYYCKLNRFKLLEQIREELGFRFSAEGSNADDKYAYRPGKRAVQELGVRSPLAEVELTKKEIRLLSRNLGLAIWEKPSAPCLATRFPYETPITTEGLELVENAEKILTKLGFDSIRVRFINSAARIEVNHEQIDQVFSLRSIIVSSLKDLGFKYVSVDLEGYRSGSMDEVLKL